MHRLLLGALVILGALLVGCSPEPYHAYRSQQQQFRFAEQPSVTASYDALDGQTTFRSRPASILLDADPGAYDDERIVVRDLILHAEATCDGVNCVPEAVALVFRGRSTSWYFARDHSLVLRADTTRFRPRTTFHGDFDGDHVEESVRAVLPAAAFQTLVSADRVSGRLGALRFRLNYHQLVGLRALAERLRASG